MLNISKSYVSIFWAAHVVLASVISIPALAQQSCQKLDAVVINCPDASKISGEPPNCFCNGKPIDQPLELTCERNFACPDSSSAGAGKFPECWCRKLKTGGNGGGGGSGGGNGSGTGSIGGSLGGAETCSQFFECPSGSKMEVQNGQCTCTLVMLPTVKE